jgi:hypothetical protein
VGTVPVNKLYGTAPATKVPTVAKFDKEVNVVLLVAVMFPAVVAFVASVAVAALPVILPTIALVTVKFAKVPTLVKLEPVIVAFKVVPVNVPASAVDVIVISPVPSNATPFIVLAVANLVAVPALPVVVVAVPAVVAVVAVVAVAALPVILPSIGLVTVKFANVPTVVKLEPVTVAFKVVPVNVPASDEAVIVISPVPSNATPFMLLAVANLVAVPALPVVVVAVPAVVAVVAVAALPVVF